MQKKVTLDELLNSQAYILFKEIIDDSLLLKTDFENTSYSLNKKEVTIHNYAKTA